MGIIVNEYQEDESKQSSSNPGIFIMNRLYKITLIFFFFSCVLYQSCSKDIQLDIILKEAGKNREALIQVLDYFRDDTFKYEAALFLIKNMSGKHYYEGWQLDTLKSIKIRGRMNDELMKEWNGFNYERDCHKLEDLQNIAADILIDNIEHACEVWLSRPWCERYSREDFYEYVLPYKIGNEAPEKWRKMYYEKYSPLMDSVMTLTKDPVEIASIICEELKSEGFDNHSDVDVPHFGPSYLFKYRVGYCRENCDIASYALRSLGIPVSTDFYLTSPAYNSRHFWNCIVDTTGRAVPFNYTENSISRDISRIDRKMGKVYRSTYGFYPPKFQDMNPEVADKIFFNPNIIDVSELYFQENTPLEITFNQESGWGMLAIFTGKEYKNIDVSKIKSRKATFKNIEEDILLFPTIKKYNDIITSGYPFLTCKSEIHEFIPDKNHKIKVVVKRKYPWMKTKSFINNILGGSIYTLSENPSKYIPVISFNDSINTNRILVECNLKGIRYIFYQSPEDKKIEIGEMHFYHAGKEILPKKITANHPLDDVHKKNLSLINDNIWHSFYLSDKGERLCFDFGEKVDFDKILFVPRNDDNFVREGQDYELFYHSGSEGWVSAGRKIANADSIIFDNIPFNSVLWLHNHSGGKEERPFYMKEGKQVFI